LDTPKPIVKFPGSFYVIHTKIVLYTRQMSRQPDIVGSAGVHRSRHSPWRRPWNHLGTQLEEPTGKPARRHSPGNRPLTQPREQAGEPLTHSLAHGFPGGAFNIIWKYDIIINKIGGNQWYVVSVKEMKMK
jgi:hypothetical protein